MIEFKEIGISFHIKSMCDADGQHMIKAVTKPREHVPTPDLIAFIAAYNVDLKARYNDAIKKLVETWGGEDPHLKWWLSGMLEMDAGALDAWVNTVKGGRPWAVGELVTEFSCPAAIEKQIVLLDDVIRRLKIYIAR